MKLQKVLNYLNWLIDQGSEFPDAFDLACWKFQLMPEEWNELKALYDTQE